VCNAFIMTKVDNIDYNAIKAKCEHLMAHNKSQLRILVRGIGAKISYHPPLDKVWRTWTRKVLFPASWRRSLSANLLLGRLVFLLLVLIVHQLW
jgi:hypothetical protein